MIAKNQILSQLKASTLVAIEILSDIPSGDIFGGSAISTCLGVYSGSPRTRIRDTSLLIDVAGIP